MDAYPAELISYGKDVCHGNVDRNCIRGAPDVPVYVVSDVPSLAVSPFRTLRFSEVGQIMSRPLPDDYLRANRVIRELAERIPNVHYVDLSEAWRGFSPQGIYEGKAAYFDGHHLNIYGSTALGRLFVETAHRVIPIESRPIASAR